ncbi:MAG: hypothetical protein ACSLE0_16000 [Chitinophagaceae bacterium]
MKHKRRIIFLCIAMSSVQLFFPACKSIPKNISDTVIAVVPPGILSFLTTRDGNFEVYSMTSDGKNVVNLTNNKALDFWSSWSPDGKFILFYSNRDGNNEIYRMDFDGTNQFNLSNHPSDDNLPSWSPDGKRIVFTSTRDHKSREIYVMDADGNNVIRMTTNEVFEEVPTWSPNGRSILFTRQIKEKGDTSHAANGEIFIMNAESGNERRLTNRQGYDSGAKFSLDGKKIAFYGQTEEKNFEIFLMNPDGSEIVNLTNDILEDYSPAWSPDGQWISYTSGNPSQYDVWLIHIKTGKKIRLTSEPKRNETPVWRPN